MVLFFTPQDMAEDSGDDGDFDKLEFALDTLRDKDSELKQMDSESLIELVPMLVDEHGGITGK